MRSLPAKTIVPAQVELLRLVEIEDQLISSPAYLWRTAAESRLGAHLRTIRQSFMQTNQQAASISVTAEHIFEVFEHLVSDLGKRSSWLPRSFSCARSRTLGMLMGTSIRSYQITDLGKPKAMDTSRLKQILLPRTSPESRAHGAMIEMAALIKTFKNAAGEFTALRGVDLTITAANSFQLWGKSGRKESTLLNMITGH
jgi:ABC-type glutathione transport system ATPase component